MLRCSFALAIWPMPLQEKPLDSVDYLLYTNISLRQKDEYGIASNAVTVLEPDLVESVALSTPNLPSHFHPKLDSGRPSLSSGAPHKIHYPPNPLSSPSNIFPLQSSNSLYLSLTTAAAYFHSLILEYFEIEESWLFSLVRLISVCCAGRPTK